MSRACQPRVPIPATLFARLLKLRSALAESRPEFRVTRADALRAALLAGFPVVEAELGIVVAPRRDPRPR